MGRSISGTMAGILSSSYKREIDYTLDLTFVDEDFHFATSPLTAVNGHNYSNDLESVGEIRQTVEAPVDQVAVALQNKDRVLGQHIATYWQKWRTANVVLGRYYYQVGLNGVRTGTTEWQEMFRGLVQQPNANDLQVTFSMIPDTISSGPIVTARTLGPNCPFVFKDPFTCAYAGAGTVCDHHLRSAGGCTGYSNTHHFGGMEHYYPPDYSVPGTGGNPGSGIGTGDGGDGGGHDGCPRLDQFIRVRGTDGKVLAKMVCFVTTDDWLWDPIERDFFPIEVARIIKNVPIWERIAGSGAVGYSSWSHRVMPHEQHATGLPVSKFVANDPVLTEINSGDGLQLVSSSMLLSQPTGEMGDVMFIEMAGGHRYASGDSEDKMTVDHNRKADPLDPLEV